MYDLKQNGDYNILISMRHTLYEQTSRFLTKIYRPDSLSSVANYDQNLPESSRLEQNYPNPFNPTTTFEYSIKTPGLVTLKVYDILGTEVASLVNERKEPGNYSVAFNATNLPSGIYFYTLTSGNFIDTKKLIMLK